MNPITAAVYLFFIAMIIAGLVPCWKGDLPLAQKLLWTFFIVVIPIAGTLLYFAIADEAKDLLQ